MLRRRRRYHSLGSARLHSAAEAVVEAGEEVGAGLRRWRQRALLLPPPLTLLLLLPVSGAAPQRQIRRTLRIRRR